VRNRISVLTSHFLKKLSTRVMIASRSASNKSTEAEPTTRYIYPNVPSENVMNPSGSIVSIPRIFQKGPHHYCCEYTHTVPYVECTPAMSEPVAHSSDGSRHTLPEPPSEQPIRCKTTQSEEYFPPVQ